MGFNSGFKGLNLKYFTDLILLYVVIIIIIIVITILNIILAIIPTLYQWILYIFSIIHVKFAY